jgi:catechol 2,3-dioxygenase-like lactoylglutathione lyase family enzyme
MSEHEGTIDSAVPVLRVARVARSMAWYADVLGFSSDPVGPPDNPFFAILRRDGVELMLQRVRSGIGEPRSATTAGGGWDIYLRIDDAHGFREAIRAKVADVGPIETREYGCDEFVLADPDGHIIVLGECG